MKEILTVRYTAVAVTVTVQGVVAAESGSGGVNGVG